METHENIKRLREALGLSQGELAQLVGYKDRSSVAKIEAGLVDISQSKIAAFAEALHVMPAALMGISEQGVPANLIPMPGVYEVPMIGEIAYCLERFRGGDVEDPDYAAQIIETFVDKVLVYDDKIVITYNFSGDGRTLEAAVIDRAASDAECSDKVTGGSPRRDNSNKTVFFLPQVFGIVALIKPPRG